MREMRQTPIHPLDIGRVHLENNLILSPMAGVNDLPFRLLAHRMGAGLVVTEMVSAKAITFKNRKTTALLATGPGDAPVAAQLFGSDEASMEEAAAYVSALPFDIIDINMGCPVPKIVKNGDGSALMKDIDLAGRVAAAAVRGANGKPVTVKFRAGWDRDHINAVDFGRAMEAAGVSAVAVHGRTREEFYGGHADWSVIGAVKAALSIPVLGNGDIAGGADVAAMYEQTGCDGFLVGRAARGNPWIFSDIRSWFASQTTADFSAGELAGDAGIAAEDTDVSHRAEAGTGSVSMRANALVAGGKDVKVAEKSVSRREIAKTCSWHAHELAKLTGEYAAVREMRKQAAFYTAGCRDSADLRRQINAAEDLAAFDSILAAWAAALP